MQSAVGCFAVLVTDETSATGYNFHVIHAVRSDGGVKRRYNYAAGDRTDADDAEWAPVSAGIHGPVAWRDGQHRKALGGRV